jgi:predicted nucleotidyltransferase
MDKREAITKVQQYRILLQQHFTIESVYLFGSYAKNSNREDSDIDVAVVVNHIDGDYFAVNPLLWKLRREVDDRIEPILIEKDYDETDFLSEVKKYGIEIRGE